MKNRLDQIKARLAAVTPGEWLNQRGLLDNPNIRWAYQKAVFKAIGLTVLRLLGRKTVRPARTSYKAPWTYPVI